MDVVRWTSSDVARRSARTIPEELIGVAAVVLDGPVSDVDLAWVATAPCPVIAVEPGTDVHDVDVVCDSAGVDALVANAVAAPRAAAVLVDVLRTVEHLDVVAGLRVESLAYSMLLASAEFTTWLADQPARTAKDFAVDPVRVDRVGDEVRVTLTRPENRNAFSAQMRDGLHEALVSASLDPAVERIVVAASGPVFSSGGDLTEFGTAEDVAVAHAIRTLRSVGRLLASLPVTVRVHGGCVGAGTELPAFAPHVLAHPDTTFRLPEMAMGLIPGAGGTVSLTKRIGRQRTAELALSGRTMEADEALAVGLVDRVEP